MYVCTYGQTGGEGVLGETLWIQDSKVERFILCARADVDDASIIIILSHMLILVFSNIKLHDKITGVGKAIFPSLIILN